MDTLVLALQQVLAQHPHRPDLGRPRLPIDRVFILPGFGTIVTGTLMDGQLLVGDPVEILPSGIKGRVRGLQTHKHTEEVALPGSRTAVNISGVHHEQIARGNTLVHPDTFETTKVLDVWFRLLSDVKEPLKHNMEVKLFIGAAEVMARVRLLGVKELAPGKDAFLQLMLQNQVVALRRDRFIIRRPSPPATIGGGQVVDPHPGKRHKRFNQTRLEALEHLLVGTPDDILLQTARKLGVSSLEAVIKASGLEKNQAKGVANKLINQGTLFSFNNGRYLLPQERIAQIRHRLVDRLGKFHQEFSLRPGMPREQLKSQLGIKSELFDIFVEQMTSDGTLETIHARVHLSDHKVRFTNEQQDLIQSLIKEFDEQPYTPPSVKQSIGLIGEELLTALIETGQLMQLDEDVLLQSEIYQEMKAAVIAHIQEQGAITLSELRDKFNTSRKYAVAVLEYLDQSGVTFRQGDCRKLRRK
jgi:selenocysteine-specific elongation factor